MYTLQAIVLAAGKSTRFKSRSSKLLEKICGSPLISYPITAIRSLEHDMQIELIAVVGYQHELISEAISAALGKIPQFVIQENQYGTGHALRCTQVLWQSDDILIINGDMPLITSHIIKNLYDQHKKTDAALSFVIAHNPDPTFAQYGRIIKDNNHIEIIEGRHFTGDTHEACCINAGIYIAKKEFLQYSIANLEQNSISKEFYLTDLVKIASDNNYHVTTVSAPFDFIRGVNTHEEFCAAERIKRTMIAYHWIEQGIFFADPTNVFIDTTVSIGEGTSVGRGVHLLGNTVIGAQSLIEEYTILDNAQIKNHVHIKPFSIIMDTAIDDHAQVGPFVHIQEKTVISDSCVIGNFVEIKRSTIGSQTKAKHLTYLGDAIIGNNVNIGAGVITCNHNGVTKNKTHIDRYAYIGSNTILIAPVTVGEHAITGAGSIITENVPSQALGIARAKQTNKLNYAQRMHTKYQNKSKNNIDNISIL